MSCHCPDILRCPHLFAEFRSIKGNSKHNESEQFNKEGDTRRADKEETAGWKSKKYQVLIQLVVA